MQSVVLFFLTSFVVAFALSVPPLPTSNNCAAQQKRVDAQNAMGAFRPTCDADGSFAAQQFHGSTGMSFCMSKDGRKLNEPSRTLKDCKCPRQKDEADPPRKPNEPMRVGAFVPRCEVDGTYSQKQVHGSTGYTKCFTPEGDEVAAARGIKSCKCFLEKHATEKDQETGMVGGFLPSCEANGSYSKQQFHGSTGYTFCVDAEGKKTGQEAGPGSGKNLSC